MAFVIAAIWKAKPGCRYYQAQVSPDDPATSFLYEQYADAQCYQEHQANEHFRQHVLGHAIDYLADQQVSTYETINA